MTDSNKIFWYQVYPKQRNMTDEEWVSKDWVIKSRFDYEIGEICEGSKRKSYVGELNTFSTKQQRLQYAENYMKKKIIAYRIKNTNTKKHKTLKNENNKNDISDLRYAFEEVLQKEKIYLDEKTIISKSVAANLFLLFCEENNINLSNINEYTSYKLSEYLVDKKYATSYINKILSIVKKIFYTIKKSGLVSSNVFSEIKKIKITDTIGCEEFTQEQAKIILTHFGEHDKQLQFACLLEFYLLIRPFEIETMQLWQIDLQNKLITIPQNKAKGHNKSIIKCIPNQLLELLLSLKIQQYPSNYYLLGKNRNHNILQPSKQTIKANTLSYRHNKELKKINKKLIDNGEFPITSNEKKQTYYAWKNTGISFLIQLGANLIYVQNQAGHSQPKMTLYYKKKYDSSQSPLINNYPSPF